MAEQGKSAWERLHEIATPVEALKCCIQTAKESPRASHCHWCGERIGFDLETDEVDDA